MSGNVVHKVVSILAAAVLTCHAIIGLISGSLKLKGGSVITFSNEPISFLGIVTIEVAVSLYVVWAFIICPEVKPEEEETGEGNA